MESMMHTEKAVSLIYKTPIQTMQSLKFLFKTSCNDSVKFYLTPGIMECIVHYR